MATAIVTTPSSDPFTGAEFACACSENSLIYQAVTATSTR